MLGLQGWWDVKRCKEMMEGGEAIRNIGPDSVGKHPGGSQTRCALSIMWYEATRGRTWGVFFVSQNMQIH